MARDVVTTVYEFHGHQLRKMKQSLSGAMDSAPQHMARIAESYKQHTGAGTYSPGVTIGMEMPDKRMMAFESLAENLFIKQAEHYFHALDEFHTTLPGKGGQLDINVHAEMLGKDGAWGVRVVSQRISSFGRKLGNNKQEVHELLADTVDIAYLKAAYRFGGTLPDVCTQTRNMAMSMLML